MFERDAVAIRTFARQNPENMMQVIFFAIATANCPFGQSVATMRLLKKWGNDITEVVYSELTLADKSGAGCGLTGMKLAAYQSLWLQRDVIFDKYMECDALDDGHLIFWHYAMDVLCGMGMVKAAFCVQMLFNKLGCIDIHNARELGYDKCPAGKAMKQRPIYLNIQSVKTSQQWWDDWCVFLAKKWPGQFTSGDHVSSLHATAIIG